MRKLITIAACLGLAAIARADEGMWQPAQLPSVAAQLKARGLELDPSQLADLTGPTMGAIVSLGFCTASFVSPDSLIVTNHHCAYGAIQYNSTAEHNLIKDGFLAKSFAEELPGDPNLRVYVTEEIRDVTREITAKLKPGMKGVDRYEAIDRAEKVLVAKCEKPGLHCDVYSFHGGYSYQLVKQREIKDVRLVYAPPEAIGKFGGDVDNWMWPRHTGDFSFLRAYVAKDGSSATYSKDNVPFKPRHFLRINAQGVKAGDYVMAAGYPGRTNRYRLAEEVNDAIAWTYPTNIKVFTDVLGIINDAGAKDPKVAVKYASSVASYNNGLKNYKGQMEGLAKARAVSYKQAKEKALIDWLAAQGGESAALVRDIDALRAFVTKQRVTRERDAIFGMIARIGLYSAAHTIYRTSLERGKPDLQREFGYQQRDEVKLEGSLKQLERRMDPGVDKQLLAYQLARYARLGPEQRLGALDAWLGSAVDESAIAAKVDALYAGTRLTDTAERLKWFKASRKDIEAADDAALKFIVALMPDLLKLEHEKKERQGTEMQLRPRYMQAMIAYNAAHGQAIYPDANSSLRVTYGTVRGVNKDGVQFLPFTTVEGIAAKTTGEAPFHSPQAEADLVAQKDYGRYASDELGTLPVDFLADLDITGGNSGSPTLDAKGRVVGLAFDGVWDSVSADWIFNPALTRSIQVDVRYMLWVMDKVDRAQNLIREMGVPE